MYTEAEHVKPSSTWCVLRKYLSMQALVVVSAAACLSQSVGSVGW